MEIFGYTIDTEALVGTVLGFASNLAIAIVILIVGRIFAGWARRLVSRSLERSNTDPTLIPFLSSMAFYAIFVAVAVGAVQRVGVQASSFVAIIGAAGLAVGLAMQGTLGNFASGVMLLVFRPFSVGHFIEAAGSVGKVKAIGLFSTEIDTVDNIRITIPNGEIFGGVVKNYSANETRRIDLVVGISYDDDIGKAMETIKSVLGADSRVLPEPAPQIAVSEMGDSSVNLIVRPWVKGAEYWDLRFDLTRALKEQLEAAGCSIPYPQRDVHIHQMGSASAA